MPWRADTEDGKPTSIIAVDVDGDGDNDLVLP